MQVALALVVTFAVAVPTLAGTGFAAEAHDIRYGYWNCDQASKLVNGPVRAGYLSELPVDGYGDNATNSFRDRARDAIGRMSSALAAESPSGNGLQWVGQVSSTNTAHIAFRYRSLPEGSNTVGITRVPASCTVVHGTQSAMPGTVYIDLNVRTDWFTQGDNRRAWWEGCPSRATDASYTCTKRLDAGSVMTHEVGHAIGLAHPRQVDAHIGSGNNTLTLADCSDPFDQATMCQAGDASPSFYRTHRRTLHIWDVTSIAFAY